MLSLDVRDSRLGLRLARGRNKSHYRDGKWDDQVFHDIPLLYCWSCGPWFSYRLNPKGGVDVLDHDYHEGWPGSCLPYEPYPESFPERPVTLIRITPKEQDLIRKNNQNKLPPSLRHEKETYPYRSPRHQVGGEPYFAQKSAMKGVTCTLWDEPMPFLASVGDETGWKKTFHDGAWLQVLFHYCGSCQVVDAHHECD